MSILTKAQLATQLAANFADNNTGAIGADDVRDHLTDMADSLVSETVIYVGPGTFTPTSDGTVPGITLGSYAFDSSTTESLALVWNVPQSWVTVDFYLWGITLGETGNVRWQADPFGTGNVASTMTVSAGITPVRHALLTGQTMGSFGPIIPVSGTDRALFVTRFDRLGGDPLDTLDGDFIVFVAELAKGS